MLGIQRSEQQGNGEDQHFPRSHRQLGLPRGNKRDSGIPSGDHRVSRHFCKYCSTQLAILVGERGSRIHQLDYWSYLEVHSS